MIHLLRGPFEKVSRPLVDFLVNRHFSASYLSLIALSGTVLASVFIYNEYWITGALLFILFSLFDALDGSLARRNKTAGPKGAFIDSVGDRFADSAIYIAVILYAFDKGNKTILLLALLALVTSLITSYVKARAECFQEFGSIGFLQRPERILIIFLMLMFPQFLVVGLWILVIGGFLTIFHRIYTAIKAFDA
ncbi:MAG: CDP-alcohol phosphatidyltransferase family protein [Desulfatiglans sp.]|jgi:CDP-diacylglycerol--glycerol-3-phosphate 3-phosphatidyltransferase|nr:CDP-alcohol phosphatidyltransferase family protein [Thermodesulfobacteriota bacterium]MEE4352302.1 CDP-alcohol phosphatidyltransferase family protein [Desulfatiglans sp.]